MGMTLEQLQQGLTNPALVQTFVTKSTEIKVPTGIKRKDGSALFVVVVKELPTTLLATAGARLGAPILGWSMLSLYTLARVLKSEGWGGATSAKAKGIAALGQAVINHARKLYPNDPDAIAQVVLKSRFVRADGLYGEQAGRYCASSLDPRPWHVELARSLLDGTIPNMVGSAEYFLDPWSPGAMQRGRELEDFAIVLDRWHNVYKWSRVVVPGISAAALMLFKEDNDPTSRERSLVAAISDWRKAHKRGREPDTEGDSVGADEEPVVFDKSRMTTEMVQTEKFLDSLAAKWPRDARVYPTRETLQFLNTLLGLKIAITNGILEARGDLRQVIFNEEQWVRIMDGLTRAGDRVIVPYMAKLTKNIKSKPPIMETELDAGFREAVLKLAIEIRSALLVIPELQDNVPNAFVSIVVGIFTVTGMAMTAFLSNSFTHVMTGVKAILNAAANAAAAAGKALLPDWLLPVAGAGLLGFIITRAASKEN